MLHNPGGSDGVSNRNDGENWSFHKVVYMFHIPPAKWCIYDIYHLCQHRENGTTSVYMYTYIYNIYIYIYYIYMYILDQHQGNLEQDAATTCNYNYHHHQPDQDQHECRCSARCSNQCNLHKGIYWVKDLALCKLHWLLHWAPVLVLIWSVMVVVVAACCCCILLQLALMLVRTLHLALVFLCFHQLAQILYLRTWWSAPAATCAGGVFSSINWHKYSSCTLGHHPLQLAWVFFLPATCTHTHLHLCNLQYVVVVECDGASRIFVAVVVVAMLWWHLNGDKSKPTCANTLFAYVVVLFQVVLYSGIGGGDASML